MTAALTILCRCSCGHARIYREPSLLLTCPDCGKEWLPERRASPVERPVRLIMQRLRQISREVPVRASGRWGGLSADGIRFIDRVRTAACADRWFRSPIYGTATHLLNAHLADLRAAKSKSNAAYDRHRQAVLVNLDAATNLFRKHGI